MLHPDGKVKEVIKTKNIIIATGSEVTPFPGLEVSDALCLKRECKLKHFPNNDNNNNNQRFYLQMVSISTSDDF